MPPLLQIDSITKSFGAVRALRGVSFELRAGEVHALLGENGAGKSTLIKIITGAHLPDSGAITIGGNQVARLTPASARQLGVACIYQQPALFPDLTATENIALRLEPAAAFRRVSWPERRQRALQLLQQVGAHFSPDREVRALSMPEQQLLEIACALGAGARIVIMDEPTASLTENERHLLFAAINGLRQSGVGLTYISHRLEEIFAIANRVTVLRDGASVGTHLVSQLNEATLIHLMVGREVSHLEPPSQANLGKIVLALRNLGQSSSGVKDVSLEVRAGEVVGLAGLVGSGRTELGQTLFGITPADAGEILLDGESISIHSPQEAVAHGIAYVPEDRRRHGIILDLPISANVTLAIHRRIFPRVWLRLGAERAVTANYIHDLGVVASGPDAAGHSLSGGNQQKVALARWLATKPRVLILDEPTQGVDVAAKSEIHQIIRRLANEGLGVLMISSDLPEVLAMSHRIAVMRGGTIVKELPRNSAPQEVMAWALGLDTAS